MTTIVKEEVKDIGIGEDTKPIVHQQDIGFRRGLDIEEDSLLTIPPNKINKNVLYHPGCNVVCTYNDPPIVSFGKVIQAAINISGVTTVMYIVQSQLPDHVSFVATRDMLQFAQGESVWAKIDQKYVEAFVYGCQNGDKMKNKGKAYSVILTHRSGLYRNIPEKHIKYRAMDSVPPIDDDEALNTSHTATCNPSQSHLGEITANPDGRKRSLEMLSPDMMRSESSTTKRLRCSLSEVQDSKDGTMALVHIPSTAQVSSVQESVDGGRLAKKALELQCFLRCQIQQKSEGLKCSVTIMGGSVNAVNEMLQAIKVYAIQSAFKSGEKLRILHDFLVINNMEPFSTGGNICVEHPPLFLKRGYSSIVDLPDSDAWIACFIGRQGAGVKQITNGTGCFLKVVRKESRKPHIYLWSKDAEEVARCRSLVKERLAKFAGTVLKGLGASK